jgi:outer membrane protein assembly factor BamB
VNLTRKLVLALSLIGLFSVAGAITANSESLAEWVTYGRDVHNTRYYPGTVDISDFGVLWEFKEPNNMTINTPLVIKDGIAYFGITKGIVQGIVEYEPGNESILYALNSTTGEQLWNYSIPIEHVGHGIRGTLTVADGVVYVPRMIYIQKGSIIALDALTGEKLWEQSTQSYIKSPITISDGRIYLGTGNSKLNALNASNGVKLWDYADTYSLNRTSMSRSGAPTVYNGNVYFTSRCSHINCTFGGAITALDAETGELLWLDTGAEFYANPVAYNGAIYAVSREDGLYAFDASDGSKLWNLPISSSIIATSPVVANGVVYLHVGSQNDTIFALDAETGEVLWEYYGLSGGGTSFESRPPIITDDMLVVVDHHLDNYYRSYCNIYVFNASTGELMLQEELFNTTNNKWRDDGWTSFNMLFGSPTLTDSILYFAFGVNWDKYVYAYTRLLKITGVTTNPDMPFTNNFEPQSISVNFQSSKYPIGVEFELYSETGFLVDTQGPVYITDSSQLPVEYDIPLLWGKGNYDLKMIVSDHLHYDVDVELGAFQLKDNEPISISNIAVSDITGSSATVTWSTNRFTNSRVNYGDAISLDNTETNESFTMEHRVKLTDLDQNTSYSYKVISCSVFGTCKNSAILDFITDYTCIASWSEWSEWSSCLNSTMTRQRTRNCPSGIETETEVEACTVPPRHWRF